MTDRDPIPQGHELAGGSVGGPRPSPPPVGAPPAPPAGPAPGQPPPVPGPPAPPGAAAPAAGPQGWVARRVVAVVLGSLMAVVGVGLLALGGAAAWLDGTQRDATGYLTTDPHGFSTPAYALTSDRIELGTTEVVAPSDLLGTVRIRVTPDHPGGAVFVGIASRAAADRYLAGVGRAVVTDWSRGATTYRYRAGGAPPAAPAGTPIWVVSASGSGTRTVTWTPTGGDWVIVVMNPDASPGVSVTADAGATVPPLGWIAVGLLVAGGVLLAAGALLIAVPVVHAGREAARSPGGSE